MADVIAVVSKAIFEKAAREHALDVGMTWPTASYVSQNKALGPLADGGRLFLVTVRVGFYEELAEIAEQLKSVGIGSLVIHPKAPRHVRKPLESKDLDPIRKAWGPKQVEIRELL